MGVSEIRKEAVVENKTIKERLQRLRDCIREEGIDFYMISSSDYHTSEYVHEYFQMRKYYSGFTGSNGTLIVSEDEAGLWTDGRYFIQAQYELEGTGITLFRMGEEGVPEIKEYLSEKMKEGETLGFDGRCIGMKSGIDLKESLQDKHIMLACEKDLAGMLCHERKKLPANEIYALPAHICGISASDKVAMVREKMKEAGAAAFFLSKLDDLMWLLNARGSDVSCNPVALSYGFLTAEQIYLFVQKEAVTQEFSDYAASNQITIKAYHEIAEFLQNFPYQGAVLLDERNTSYLLYQCILQQTKVIKKDNPTELLKAVKNETELARMRETYLLDSVAVIRFIHFIKHHAGKESLDEVSAADYLDELRRKTKGFLDLSFPTICGYQENAAMMHYAAAKESCKQLNAEGMLLVDSGGQYMGGTTDVTRTIVLGPISKEMKLHYTKVTVGMLRLLHAVYMQGCTGRNLDILARQPLWEIGIDYKCGTGHGIGYILNVHEGPQGIRFKYLEGVREQVILPGMVFSNEPGVYIEGSHGIRIENVMVAKDRQKNADGQFMEFETLTYVPIDKDGLDASLMNDADIDSLNRYHKQVYEKTKDYLTEEERVWLKEATSPISQF